jgi:hypothetical protein
MAEKKKTDLEQIKGILEEFSKEDIATAIQEMDIESPRTAEFLADGLQEKIKILSAITDTRKFWLAVKDIDSSKVVMKEAEKDPVAYFKRRGIDIPEGVDIKSYKETKGARAVEALEEKGKKDVGQIKGILEEFSKEDIMEAVMERGIEFPRTTELLADGLQEKIKTLATITDTRKFWLAVKDIDSSKVVMKEAEKDLVAYFKRRGIDIPEGVDIKSYKETKGARKALAWGPCICFEVGDWKVCVCFDISSIL